MELQVGNKTIECVKGDITHQPDCDAVVNAANAQLQIGGGVAGAIHKAAGPELARECRPMAPISPGQAVISGGHQLPNEHVIHCLGPVYGRDKPEDELLAQCHRNAIDPAEQHQLQSIAFPALSTGAFGYPLEEAAPVALNATKEALANAQYPQHVRFVLFGQKDLNVFEEHLRKL
ncbi:MAG: RNase III inhibitor [Bacteroidetes bacterium SW_11_45_7]|nr:MAG: RNase III inhibitor [Bacteroidetes bacterium SW_11_45_7]